ncbi:acetate kinase [Ornithobacterium rhinotracheale]|uniref:Acetate kinase n=1 Tax=Ornithobacterium rhinotracheale TaxID=28251 RepID=A0A3R6AUM9_ORNRH|nr:acetate kinase [Ornithobacterium rhinotracheale]QAR30921.1 acetate kinase [Ornithobacterium rhinotracheale]
MNKKILVINSGSSSLKFQLFEMPQEKVLAQGIVERIGQDISAIHYKTDEGKFSAELEIPNHEVALKEVTTRLLDPTIGVISNVEEVDIVAHRVVHGGEEFTETVKITQEVKEKIKSLFPLAPLHNPANLKGIEVAEKLFNKATQVAVFDTSFFKTLPEFVYRYAIPKDKTDKTGIRVYGFHGISHKYVSKKAYEYLNDNTKKLITIHLGNGCSMTAVNQGKAVDHSLGYGPNDGLIMGTRSGAIDPAVVVALQQQNNWSAEEVSNFLSKESGMKGLTGHSDMRDIEDKALTGDQDCQLALDMNTYRIKKFIGAYIAALNGVDALVFTAGIGENSDVVRALATKDLEYLGIKINPEENKIRSKEIREINTEDSKIKVLVIPTNEELEMAQEAYNL